MSLKNAVFVPPFLGSEMVKGIPLDDIAAYVNENHPWIDGILKSIA